MKYKPLLVFTTTFLLSIAVSAAPQWCSGQITSTWIDEAGHVVIKGTWRNDHTQVCNLNTTWKGVTTETCKGWLSLAQVAQVAKTGVTVYYADITSCADMPVYQASPNPGYVMLTE